jgi:hypothetical protein
MYTTTSLLDVDLWKISSVCRYLQELGRKSSLHSAPENWTVLVYVASCNKKDDGTCIKNFRSADDN